jgi:hypothetical protein
MSTMRTILTRAIRMTRARPLGDIPAAEEMEAALEDAQDMLMGLPIRRLTDVLIDDDYEAGENQRITYLTGSPVITYPDTVEVSSTTERTPQNGALVEVAAAAGSTRKIYIAELKTWMTVTALTLESEQPFGPTHDLDVAAMIAARISGPVLQHEVPGDVVAIAGMGRTKITNAFRQTYTPNFGRALLGPATSRMDA